MSAGLKVGYDQRIWVELEPGDLTPEAWAQQEAARCFRDTGQAPVGDGLQVLTSRLLLLQEQCAELAPMAFWYLPSPDPEVPPGPLALLSAFDLGPDGDEALAAFAGADDPMNIEPASLRPFETALGKGLRCRRFSQRDPSRPGRPGGPVVLVVSYVWHLPELDADIRLVCSSDDLVSVAQVEADLDALARSVVLVDL